MNVFKNWLPSALLFVAFCAAAPASAAETWGFIDEIQVLNDMEGTTAYRYALVYLTPTGGVGARYILPLPNSEQLSVLLSAQSAGKKVYISGSTSWGMQPSKVLGVDIVSPKIDRVIVYTK